MTNTWIFENIINEIIHGTTELSIIAILTYIQTNPLSQSVYIYEFHKFNGIFYELSLHMSRTWKLFWLKCECTNIRWKFELFC